MMKRLCAMLFVLALLTQSALAATLAVRADGNGDYTSIAAAVNAAADGDIVEIQDSAVYAETAQAYKDSSVANLTLRAAAGQTPTWDFTALGDSVPALTIDDGSGWTITGIKFLYEGPVATGVWTCAIRTAGNCPAISHCTFMGTMGAGIYYSVAGAANAGVDLSYCSFFSSDADSATNGDLYCVFWGVPFTGTFEVDHCTMGGDGVSGTGNLIMMWDNAAGSPNHIAISNCIFYGNELGYWCADFTGGTNMTFEYVISSASAHNPGWTGTATDLGNNSVTLDNMLTDPASGDFSLQEGAPALAAAADGSNIGAWQGAGAPVEPTVITVRADGTGDFTSIAAAINSATGGEIIEIQDSAVYAETVQAYKDSSVTTLTVRVAEAQTPTWDFTALGDSVPALTIDDGSSWTITGIKFLYEGPVATGVWTCAIRTAGNCPAISHCTFMGTMGAGIYYSVAGAANAGVDLSYCSFFSSDADSATNGDLYCVFWGVPFTGTFEVDHCTMGGDGVSGTGNLIMMRDNTAGAVNSIAISNCIFYGNELGYWCADFDGGTNMTYEYVISSASAHVPGWVGTPTDLGNNSIALDNLLGDPANGDFSLQEGAPALGAAADGSNIGAWQEGEPTAADLSWIMLD